MKGARVKNGGLTPTRGKTIPSNVFLMFSSYANTNWCIREIRG